jgi:hypothetical protein
VKEDLKQGVTGALFKVQSFKFKVNRKPKGIGVTKALGSDLELQQLYTFPGDCAE